MRDNPMGWHIEWWHHSAGCRQWVKVVRNTLTHQIAATGKPGDDSRCRRNDAGVPPATGRTHRPRPDTRFRVRWPGLQGHPGDTLASALLANGVRLVGRSFKYHRPRGIFTAGAEEPKALVELRNGARREPNTRATVAELFAGLEARARTAGRRCGSILVRSTVGSPAFCPRASTTRHSCGRRLFGSGSTSRRSGAWLASGVRRASPIPMLRAHACALRRTGRGIGAAGLAAARAAGESGARVMLMEQDFELGGGLLLERDMRHGATGCSPRWRMPEVRLLPRTTVFGYYDHNVLGAVERVSDHLRPPEHGVRQRYWVIRARQVVLATGAIERLIAFPTTTAQASCWRRRRKRTCGATAWCRDAAPCCSRTTMRRMAPPTRCRRRIAGAGHRRYSSQSLPPKARGTGFAVWTAAEISGVTGTIVRGLQVRWRQDGRSNAVPADLLCVSGGFNPSVNLASMTRAPLTGTQISPHLCRVHRFKQNVGGCGTRRLWRCARCKVTGPGRRGGSAGIGTWQQG